MTEPCGPDERLIKEMKKRQGQSRMQNKFVLEKKKKKKPSQEWCDDKPIRFNKKKKG